MDNIERVPIYARIFFYEIGGSLATVCIDNNYKKSEVVCTMV
jgi:hypothetical protein